MASLPFDPSLAWLIPIGFVIGVLVTMFGGGGGFFYVPILTLLFRVPTQAATATSLAATIPTVVIGSIEHYRKGNVDLKVGLSFGLAGFLGAIGGALISGLFSSILLQRLFGVYALVLTVPMILTSKGRLSRGEGAGGAAKEVAPGSGWWRMSLSVMFGALSGLMSGLFGTSGTATIVAGLYVLGLPVRMVIGTSVLVVLCNAISGFGSQALVGNFDLPLVVLLASGSVLGAFVGPRLLDRIDAAKLEKVYGVLFIVLVLGFGVAMLLK
jgi:Predicted permeases